MPGLTHRLARLLRHCWCDETDLRRALPKAALERIEARVKASEQGHSGQVRVAIEPALPLSYLRRGLPARARAVTLFGKLRVWDTEHNNGVLIYLLLADRAIEIIADRGLVARVPADHWNGIVDAMHRGLREDRCEDALVQAVAAIDALLRAHFPRAAGKAAVNELPDAPVVL